MTLNHEVRGQDLVCRPEGDFDESTGPGIAAAAAAPESASVRAVILDMGATTYISSSGVAALLKLQADLAAGKRALSLAAPSPLVRRILYQAGVSTAVPIHLTVEEACRKRA